MRIALHACEHNKFPNLPLMKLSSHHKQFGDTVEFFKLGKDFDIIYSSKIFTYSKSDSTLPASAVKGGTGYDFKISLSDSIEHVIPDYSLYPDFKASLGFTTRGCIRNCPWCIVPKKEGKLRAHAEIKEFLRTDSQDVVLMDNNILASEHGLKQLEFVRDHKLKLDCNQGLDVRLIAGDEAIATLLSKIKWIRFIRVACDTDAQLPYIKKAVALLKTKGVKPYRIFCYVLLKDFERTFNIVEELRAIGVDPFVQPYRDFNSVIEPPRLHKAYARYVNLKKIFKSASWEEYKKLIKGL